MTLPKDQKIEHEKIESMNIAVEEAGIPAIHPDKMEEFAEYLAQRTDTRISGTDPLVRGSFLCDINYKSNIRSCRH